MLVMVMQRVLIYFGEIVIVLRNFDYWLSLFLSRLPSVIIKNYATQAQPNFANTHNLSIVGKYWIDKWRSQVGFCL